MPFSLKLTSSGRNRSYKGAEEDGHIKIKFEKHENGFAQPKLVCLLILSNLQRENYPCACYRVQIGQFVEKAEFQYINESRSSRYCVSNAFEIGVAGNKYLQQCKWAYVNVSLTSHQNR